jgi:hypothetical protein
MMRDGHDTTLEVEDDMAISASGAGVAMGISIRPGVPKIEYPTGVPSAQATLAIAAFKAAAAITTLNTMTDSVSDVPRCTQPYH